MVWKFKVGYIAWRKATSLEGRSHGVEVGHMVQVGQNGVKVRAHGVEVGDIALTSAIWWGGRSHGAV